MDAAVTAMIFSLLKLDLENAIRKSFKIMLNLCLFGVKLRQDD